MLASSASPLAFSPDAFNAQTYGAGGTSSLRELEVLGRGTFGTAVLVEDPQTRAKCVVKEINMHHLSESKRKTALKEADFLRSAGGSPFITTYLGSFVRDGIIFLAMEYCACGPLDVLIKERAGKRLPTDDLLDYVVQICAAVRHVHGLKMIHRDIKASNVFLCNGTHVKLGDFGIARQLDSTGDVAQTLVGTPYHLSPEAIEGLPYSQPSDVWALGVLVYQLASLRLPFQGKTLPSLAYNIVGMRYQPLTDAPEPLNELVLSMLSKEAERRPTMNRVLQDPQLSSRLAQIVSRLGLPEDPVGVAASLGPTGRSQTWESSSSSSEPPTASARSTPSFGSSPSGCTAVSSSYSVAENDADPIAARPTLISKGYSAVSSSYVPRDADTNAQRERQTIIDTERSTDGSGSAYDSALACHRKCAAGFADSSSHSSTTPSSCGSSLRDRQPRNDAPSAVPSQIPPKTEVAAGLNANTRHLPLEIEASGMRAEREVVEAAFAASHEPLVAIACVLKRSTKGSSPRTVGIGAYRLLISCTRRRALGLGPRISRLRACFWHDLCHCSSTDQHDAGTSLTLSFSAPPHTVHLGQPLATPPRPFTLPNLFTAALTNGRTGTGAATSDSAAGYRITLQAGSASALTKLLYAVRRASTGVWMCISSRAIGPDEEVDPADVFTVACDGVLPHHVAAIRKADEDALQAVRRDSRQALNADAIDAEPSRTRSTANFCFACRHLCAYHGVALPRQVLRLLRKQLAIRTPMLDLEPLLGLLPLLADIYATAAEQPAPDEGHVRLPTRCAATQSVDPAASGAKDGMWLAEASLSRRAAPSLDGRMPLALLRGLLGAAACCGLVEEVWSGGARLPEGAIEAFASCLRWSPHLRTLACDSALLRGTTLASAVAEALPSSRAPIDSLCLSSRNSPVDVPSTLRLVAALRQLPNALHTLELTRCSLCARSFAPLCTLLAEQPWRTQLRRLSLAGNSSGALGSKLLMAPLQSTIALESLDISDTDMEAEALLGAMLSNGALCRTLGSLFLDGLRLPASSVAMLCKLVAKAPKLVQLAVARTQLLPSAFDSLLAVLLYSNERRGARISLDASWNRLGQGAVDALTQHLPARGSGLSSLCALRLCGAGLTSHGVAEICRLCAVHGELVHLDLSDNMRKKMWTSKRHIEPNLGEAVARLLHESEELRSLAIGSHSSDRHVKCEFPGGGAVIAVHKSLTALDLTALRIPDEEQEALAASLSQNHALILLAMRRDSFPPPPWERDLQRVLDRNRELAGRSSELPPRAADDYFGAVERLGYLKVMQRCALQLDSLKPSIFASPIYEGTRATAGSWADGLGGLKPIPNPSELANLEEEGLCCVPSSTPTQSPGVSFAGAGLRPTVAAGAELSQGILFDLSHSEPGAFGSGKSQPQSTQAALPITAPQLTTTSRTPLPAGSPPSLPKDSDPGLVVTDESAPELMPSQGAPRPDWVTAHRARATPKEKVPSPSEVALSVLLGEALSTGTRPTAKEGPPTPVHLAYPADFRNVNVGLTPSAASSHVVGAPPLQHSVKDGSDSTDSFDG